VGFALFSHLPLFRPAPTCQNEHLPAVDKTPTARPTVKRLLPLLALALLPAPLCAAEPFQLAEGNRVAFVGSTFIEREQRSGYWETALTSRYPDRDVTFRNLGWSGDTIWGEARAGFDTPKEGYKRLLDATLAVKPTVIALGYGTNESFAGAAGLAKFQEQLNKLLDDLAPSKARFVLLAPPRFEKERWLAGDFDRREHDLEQYTDAIRQVAGKRHALFVDEFCQRYAPAAPLTDDGMHLTAYGYRRTAPDLLAELHGPDGALKLVELDGLTPKKVCQDFLPNPPVPQDPPNEDWQADSKVIARGLKPGKYTLQIDGRPVHTADAEEWMHPAAFNMVLVRQGPSLDQAEKLRQTIVGKNRLYFHRWRPENETYLFGFRKKEQGQNAKEIPEFDPLVEQLEKEIARLRKPVPHTYELVPAAEEKK
jgi:lysophospholipase L1-like esterase